MASETLTKEGFDIRCPHCEGLFDRAPVGAYGTGLADCEDDDGTGRGDCGDTFWITATADGYETSTVLKGIEAQQARIDALETQLTHQTRQRETMQDALDEAHDKVHALAERVEGLEEERNKLDDLAELEGAIAWIEALLADMPDEPKGAILASTLKMERKKVLRKFRAEHDRVAGLAPATVSRERREALTKAMDERDECQEHLDDLLEVINRRIQNASGVRLETPYDALQHMLNELDDKCDRWRERADGLSKARDAEMRAKEQWRERAEKAEAIANEAAKLVEWGELARCDGAGCVALLSSGAGYFCHDGRRLCLDCGEANETGVVRACDGCGGSEFEAVEDDDGHLIEQEFCIFCGDLRDKKVEALEGLEAEAERLNELAVSEYARGLEEGIIDGAREGISEGRDEVLTLVKERYGAEARTALRRVLAARDERRGGE